nr:hypothetical protein [Tanacetum cinerariifolium]
MGWSGEVDGTVQVCCRSTGVAVGEGRKKARNMVWVLFGFVRVQGTCFSSLEGLKGLILNIPGAITLSFFTTFDPCSVEIEFEVTGFDKACVSPTLGGFPESDCFANLVFALLPHAVFF